VKSAPGVIGKIQVGAEPGGSAQVIVPAVGVPLAVGTVPNAPVDELIDPPDLPAEQAARPMAAAVAAAATHTTSVLGRRELVIGFPRNHPGARACHRSWLICGPTRAYGWPWFDLGRILSQVAIDVKTDHIKPAPFGHPYKAWSARVQCIES
jgi:hypothetical protein